MDRNPGRPSARPCKPCLPRVDADVPRRRPTRLRGREPARIAGEARDRGTVRDARFRSVKRYDVIVVGGGHNGLACAAYLARAGLHVLVCERRHVVGGPCAEYEYFPGYRASITNSPGSLEPRVVADLELARHGLTFTRPDPTLMFPFPDGRAFVGWRDRARAAEQIGQFSAGDVDGYAALFDFLNRFAERLGASLFEAPPTLRALTSRLETPRDEEAFAKVFLGSVADLLDEFLESGHIKSMLAMLGVMSNWVSPFSPGSATWLMMRPMSLASSSVAAEHDPRRQVLRGSTGLPLGGMGSIVRAMRRSLEAAGGEVRTECEVRRIPVRAERAAGVVLADGEEIEAGAVVSNLDPWTTYLELVEAPCLDPGFRTSVERLPRRGSAFKVALALDGIPDFAAAPPGLERACAGCQFRIAPSMEYQDRAFEDARHGRPSRGPVFWGLFPTVADPTLAPPGRHILSANIFHAPNELREGSWSTERDRFGEHCIDVLERYLPGLKDRIVDRRFWSPADLEAEFGLPGANITHLDMTPRHMFGLRPLAGFSDHRSPIAGLYNCGSSTWPGGTVTGAPGYNAGRRVLGDMGRGGGRLHRPDERPT